MSRNRRRHLSPNSYPLYAAETSRGWRVTRIISFAEAELKVEQGSFARVLDQAGSLIGFQMVDAGCGRDVIKVVSPAVSSASIAARESQANAGLLGRSHTVAMSEDQKLRRVHPKSGKHLPPEDFVERARNKVRVYPQTFSLNGAERNRQKP